MHRTPTRYVTCVCVFALCAALAGCSDRGSFDGGAILPHGPTSLSYAVYHTYHYRGPLPASDTTMFFQTSSKSGFDSLFFYIADHNPYPRIPPEDLSLARTVSVVKYGNDYYSLQPASIMLLGNVLEVHYTSVLQAENLTWTPVTSMIVVVRADYQKVRFIENGKVVGEQNG